jgi:hypothetical protein
MKKIRFLLLAASLQLVTGCAYSEWWIKDTADDFACGDVGDGFLDLMALPYVFMTDIGTLGTAEAPPEKEMKCF